MGTNYYLNIDTCSECGRSDKQMHIGKSSAGWCFSLHVEADAECGPTNMNDWLRLFNEPRNSIEDEYGRAVGFEDMRDTIAERAWKDKKDEPHGYDDWGDFHRRNHSEDGPNGLLRSVIDGSHCIGHGSGTWDLITGDFS